MFLGGKSLFAAVKAAFSPFSATIRFHGFARLAAFLPPDRLVGMARATAPQRADGALDC
jgi:hypothetical protein